ncbi:MAG TPA: TldD/PmbA family protein [Candidatus Desulfaltia sp.]|nr:TldD/PmbA family protein [Candidatus Desulfaltia sp.]
MDFQSLAENIVKKALKSGADEAEAYLTSGREFGLTVRNGDVETVKQATSKGMGLTVFKDKKLGFSYTSDFSDEGLGAFVQRAIQLSLVADPKPWNGLPDFEKGKPKELDLFDPSIAEIPNEKKIDIARQTEKIALSYDKRITKSDGGTFGDSETDVIIVNSKGISYASKSSQINFGVGVIAGEGSNMQPGYWSSPKRHAKDLDTVENVGKTAGKRAVDKLGPKPVETQKVPVVFDWDAAPAFWFGIFWAINGDSVFKKTTFLTEYLGKPIASELITLVDDPTIPRHVSSLAFDGEGNITRENILIEKGILKMFIYDSITARKAGVKVNTMAQRYSYKSRPSANFLNLIVRNGKMDREKLIAGIKNGLYVTILRGIGTDPTTGTYSCGASGFWIKGGEIAFPVDKITLGGNTLEMLKNIEAVANDLELRWGLNSPSFKISEVTVGGKR